MLRNLTPFPIRIGSAQAPEIPSSGAPRVQRATGTVELVSFEDHPELGEVRVESAGAIAGIDGLPDAEFGVDVILPLAVVEAMRATGRTTGGRVFTPMMLREEGGVKFAPGLIRHPDVETRWR